MSVQGLKTSSSVVRSVTRFKVDGCIVSGNSVCDWVVGFSAYVNIRLTFFHTARSRPLSSPHAHEHLSIKMVSYGICNEDADYSYDDLQPLQPSRKRTFPTAFPVEKPAQLYPYNAVPVAIESSHERNLPLGLMAGFLVTYLTTALAWIQYAAEEYGRKFFQAGMNPEGLEGVLSIVGSWMERHRAQTGDDELPVPKRQRVMPGSFAERRDERVDIVTEHSPLLMSRRSRPKTPPPPMLTTPTKPKVEGITY